MFKKFTYALTVLLVVFGMLAVAVPAHALGTQRALKGTIVSVNTKARTMSVAPLHGKPVTLRVPKSTVIIRKGKAGSFAKLRVGIHAHDNIFGVARFRNKIHHGFSCPAYAVFFACPSFSFC